MTKIQDITNEYKNLIDFLDLEILIANSLGKTREFVLTHPEYKITSHQSSVISKSIKRRATGEPIAYILGHKEFFGLDFVVNKHTLIPRPETEMMVEEAIHEACSMKHIPKNTSIIDVGTGSGCIITAIAHELENNTKYKIQNTKYYSTDISKEALKVAKKNAKNHGVDKEIKFLESDLLSKFIQDTRYEIQDTNLIIVANLPYLSKDIYNSAPIDVKKFEPKSALYSGKAGLAHYRRLLKQLASIQNTKYKIHTTSILEISPEQKQPLTKIIKNIFPSAKIEFQKDLAKKWRLCRVEFSI